MSSYFSGEMFLLGVLLVVAMMCVEEGVAVENALAADANGTETRDSPDLAEPDNVTCHLHPKGINAHERVRRYLQDGAKILKYELTFPDHAQHPLVFPASANYEPRIWQRVTSQHGSALLSLSFNYDVLSLSMLRFGVEAMAVPLTEVPLGCLENLSEDERFKLTRDLLMDDFLLHRDDLWLEDDDHLCNYVISESRFGGRGEFAYECCSKTTATKNVTCSLDQLYNPWISIMYYLLEAARVLFFLYGPLLLKGFLFDGDVRRSVPYVVYLTEKAKCVLTLVGRGVNKQYGPTRTPEPIVKVVWYDEKYPAAAEGGGVGGGGGVRVRADEPPSQQKLTKQEAEDGIKPGADDIPLPMGRLQKNLMPHRTDDDQVMTVEFDRLHLKVDHTQLMAQNEVPVSVLSFLYQQIVRCGVLAHDPFRACGDASICCGNTSRFFLCWRLPDIRIKPPVWITRLTWSHVAQFLGWLVLMAVIVPLPFHVRVLVFFFYESDEIERRERALSDVGLSGPYVESFWLGNYWPQLVIAWYAAYFVTFVLISFLRMFVYDRERFDDKIKDCLLDLENISSLSIIKMFFAHALLPLQMFGFWFGLLLAVFYVPVALLLGLFVALFYGVPLFYMSGRLISKFRAIKDCSCGGEDEDEEETSGGLSEDEHEAPNKRFTLDRRVTSFQDAYFFRKISPNKWEFPRLQEDTLKKANCCALGRRHRACKTLLGMTVGIICFVQMTVIMLMYAEAFRFFLEMICMTIMGVIVNSDVALDVFMLVVWIAVYCQTTFKQVHEKYLQLSAEIFSLLKSTLKDRITDVTRLPEKAQKNTAFKYFTMDHLREMVDKAELYSDGDFESEKYEGRRDRLMPRGSDTLSAGAANRSVPTWDVAHLVLFVNNLDEARIPKAFFWKVVEELKAPGCPGTLTTSMLGATRKLFYMILVLLFVFIIIMSFGRGDGGSGSGQVLLTVAGGFLPFVIRIIIMPKGADIDLSFYSWKGKLEEIIWSYKQEWPVLDLDFKPMRAVLKAAPAGRMPLLQVRPAPREAEDDDDDQLRHINPFTIDLDDFVFENKFHTVTFGFQDGPVKHQPAPKDLVRYGEHV